MNTPPAPPQNHPEIQDQLVLVTGGSRGIGLAISSALAAAGARVLATTRSASRLPDALPAAGQVTTVPLEVQSETSVNQLFSWIDSQQTPLRALINNAGIGVFKPLTQITSKEFETVLQTNLTGSFLCMREAAKRMVPQKRGRIIQLGSISDHLLLPENSAYAASKFGVRALVGILNEELKHQGVFASLVSPGATLTEIWQGREGFNPDDMIPPEEVARTVVDILSRPAHVRIDEVRILPSRGVL